jgi:hypothetical protein
MHACAHANFSVPKPQGASRTPRSVEDSHESARGRAPSLEPRPRTCAPRRSHSAQAVTVPCPTPLPPLARACAPLTPPRAARAARPPNTSRARARERARVCVRDPCAFLGPIPAPRLVPDDLARLIAPLALASAGSHTSGAAAARRARTAHAHRAVGDGALEGDAAVCDVRGNGVQSGSLSSVPGVAFGDSLTADCVRTDRPPVPMRSPAPRGSALDGRGSGRGGGDGVPCR